MQSRVASGLGQQCFQNVQIYSSREYAFLTYETLFNRFLAALENSVLPMG